MNSIAEFYACLEISFFNLADCPRQSIEAWPELIGEREPLDVKSRFFSVNLITLPLLVDETIAVSYENGQKWSVYLDLIQLAGSVNLFFHMATQLTKL